MTGSRIIGVMGPGENASYQNIEDALQLGKCIAAEGWITLSGGRNVGVMDAVSRGAKENKGLTIGILPDAGLQSVSDYIDIPILTGMGSARNHINVLTAHVVVACGIGAATTSEIALALKAQKPVILLGYPPEGIHFLQMIDSQKLIRVVTSTADVIKEIKKILDN